MHACTLRLSPRRVGDFRRNALPKLTAAWFIQSSRKTRGEACHLARLHAILDRAFAPPSGTINSRCSPPSPWQRLCMTDVRFAPTKKISGSPGESRHTVNASPPHIVQCRKRQVPSLAGSLSLKHSRQITLIPPFPRNEAMFRGPNSIWDTRPLQLPSVSSEFLATRSYR